jgi:hypothetical protein
VTESTNGDAVINSSIVTIDIKARIADRVRFPSVQIYAASENPVFSGAWTNVDLIGTNSLRNGQAVEFVYAGDLNGVRQHLIVHWYLRGDRLIEVTLRVNGASWQNLDVQDDVRMVLASFAVDHAGARVPLEDVFNAVTERFPGNPRSGIIVRDDIAGGTVELTCIEAVAPHVQQPVYQGNGEWKIVTSLEPHGYNEWTVYEPGLQVVASAGNDSNC